MPDYTLPQLLNLQQVQSLLEAHTRISGMACGLTDDAGNIIVSAGLQQVCTAFHWKHPSFFARCWRNGTGIKQALHGLSGNLIECRCKNGMLNIAVPIVIEGERLGVFFSGQFFYDDQPPDLAWLQNQAEELGFEIEPYLEAVRKVPLLNRSHVDNTMRFLHQLVQLLAETGYTNLMRGRELDERKQTTQQIRLLSHTLDSVQEGAFLIDLRGRFIYVNQAACRSLGYDRDELLGMTISDIDPDFPASRIAEHLAKLLEAQALTFETRHRARNGHIFPVEISNSMLVYEHSSYFLALARNITERKQAEQKLYEKQQRLNDMALELTLSEEQERRRIAVDLHDTLGQNLTLTRMKLGGLKKIGLSTEQNDIVVELDHLTETAINRVRSLTRLISPPVLESAGLEAALKWLARQIETDYGLQIAFSDDLQDKTVTREHQIEIYSSVRELLINVAKHAGTETVCLSVSREADLLAIRVEDDGVGFEADTFWNNPDCDGFGLFTIRRRITYMGGSLKITSQPGSGTEITILVPLSSQSVPFTTRKQS